MNQRLSLAASVLAAARDRDTTLAFAESLTGGALADAVVSVSGASDVFLGSVVAYHNLAKQHLLSVAAGALSRWGAVSAEVAQAMALGAYQEFQPVCHGRPLVIVSTTGVAGPGAQDRVPAGRVYLALYSHDQQLVREFDFRGDRAEVRDQTVVQALLLLSDYFSAQRG